MLTQAHSLTLFSTNILQLSSKCYMSIHLTIAFTTFVSFYLTVKPFGLPPIQLENRTSYENWRSSECVNMSTATSILMETKWACHQSYLFVCTICAKLTFLWPGLGLSNTRACSSPVIVECRGLINKLSHNQPKHQHHSYKAMLWQLDNYWRSVNCNWTAHSTVHYTWMLADYWPPNH